MRLARRSDALDSHRVARSSDVSDLHYTVSALNISAAAENKIHDDAIARRYGFTGGLVAGVEVYAYATHVAVARWGRIWLERGRMDIRFDKPVYDGRAATVTGSADADALAIVVACDGVACAQGMATCSSAPDGSSPASIPRRAAPEATARPLASEATLAAGTLLSSRPLRVDAERAAAYLRDVREMHAIYATERIVHPGLILRTCNAVLADNIVLPAWVHVASHVTHLATARVGQTLTAAGRVTRETERRGHRFVELDVVVLGDDQPVAQVAHTAIWRLRGV